MFSNFGSIVQQIDRDQVNCSQTYKVSNILIQSLPTLLASIHTCFTFPPLPPPFLDKMGINSSIIFISFLLVCMVQYKVFGLVVSTYGYTLRMGRSE